MSEKGFALSQKYLYAVLMTRYKDFHSLSSISHRSSSVAKILLKPDMLQNTPVEVNREHWQHIQVIMTYETTLVNQKVTKDIHSLGTTPITEVHLQQMGETQRTDNTAVLLNLPKL